jgi:hypothetical protein
MKRFTRARAAAISSILVAAAAVVLGPLGGSAAAAELELGQTTTPLTAPTCPAKGACNIVLTEMTVFETLRDGLAYPTQVHHAGEIVAFSLGVSPISTNAKTFQADLAYLESRYGGTPQAALTVLRPAGPHASFRWAVAAESQPVQLLPYLGEVTQFPLLQPMPVVPGEILGITVPTWAPILAINLEPTDFAYRQSRSQSCSKLSNVVLAQLSIGDSAGYGCTYPGTSAEYSATEITSPVPTR